MTEIMRKESALPLPHRNSFLNLCGSSVSHLFFWYLYRLWPIATSKTSSLTEWIPLRTILLYQRSFFIIPKVPSACIERFIRNNAPWILSRFSITSRCMEVNSWLIRTVRFLSVFLHFSAYGHPLQSSHSYNSSLRPYWFPLTFFLYKKQYLMKFHVKRCCRLQT